MCAKRVDKKELLDHVEEAGDNALIVVLCALGVGMFWVALPTLLHKAWETFGPMLCN
jgi:hypothetical protein